MEEVTNYFDAWVVPLTADVLACRLFSLRYWKPAWSRDWLTARPKVRPALSIIVCCSARISFLAARQLSSTFDVRPISHFFNPGYLWASTITEETILKLLSLLRSLQDAGETGSQLWKCFRSLLRCLSTKSRCQAGFFDCNLSLSWSRMSLKAVWLFGEGARCRRVGNCLVLISPWWRATV